MTAKQSPEIIPTKSALDVSIRACIENGEIILDDVDMLQVQEPLSRQVALSIIAQEECAKAFVLILVRDDGRSWKNFNLIIHMNFLLFRKSPNRIW
jgi:hypothetical protein